LSRFEVELHFELLKLGRFELVPFIAATGIASAVKIEVFIADYCIRSIIVAAIAFKVDCYNTSATTINYLTNFASTIEATGCYTSFIIAKSSAINCFIAFYMFCELY
jgi:hypothetical protein